MFVSNVTMFPFLWLTMSFLVIHFKMCDTTVGAYETIEKIKIIIIIIIIIIMIMKVQWKLDITKGEETGKNLFAITRLFSYTLLLLR